jgi:hypothetical protein
VDFLFPDAPDAGEPQAQKTTGRRALFCFSVRIRAVWPCK